jgi:hypothetical protein
MVEPQCGFSFQENCSLLLYPERGFKGEISSASIDQQPYSKLGLGYNIGGVGLPLAIAVNSRRPDPKIKKAVCKHMADPKYI